MYHSYSRITYPTWTDLGRRVPGKPTSNPEYTDRRLDGRGGRSLRLRLEPCLAGETLVRYRWYS